MSSPGAAGAAAAAGAEEEVTPGMRKELNRQRTMRRAERLLAADPLEGLPAPSPSLTEEQRARLAALSEAWERDSREAHRMTIEWSRRSEEAFRSRTALRKYYESLASPGGGGPDKEEEGGQEQEERPSPFSYDGMLSRPPPDDGSLVSRAAVVLVRTTGATNLGQIARLANNVGVSDVRLVDPRCDPGCGEARKFAVHSRRLLDGMPVFATLAEAVADCGAVLATSGRQTGSNAWRGEVTPEGVPALLAGRPRAERFAVVFGNEADGLNEAELSQCHSYVRIPTRGYSSLNLGHAVAVVMYTLSRVGVRQQDAEERHAVDERVREAMAAPMADVARLAGYWEATLRRFGWQRPVDAAAAVHGYVMERRTVARLLGQLRHVNVRAFGSDHL